MTIAYLNGDYAPLADVRISPMDRGFLFGDGVYEVIPCYDGNMVALQYHLERLHQSLEGITLSQPHSDAQLTGILSEVVARNGAGNLGIYLQITRGVVEKREHAFPEHSLPTIFAYAFDINPPSDGSPVPSRWAKIMRAALPLSCKGWCCPSRRKPFLPSFGVVLG